MLNLKSAGTLYSFLYFSKNSKNMSETNDTINSLEALLISIHKQIEKEVKTLIG
jgi:hypothetical protein